MSAPAHIARENGKKGGRPKGSKANHTLQAEQAKAELIRMYMEKVKPINAALLKKAEEGDIPAIKELHDRVWGKAPQALTGPDGKELKIIFDPVFNASAQ